MWLRTLYYTARVFGTLKCGRAELESFQRRRADDIVETARELSFYRDLWPDGAGDDTADDLSRFPVIDDSSLQEIAGDKGSSSLAGASRRTSGTTGVPEKVPVTGPANDWMSAVHLRTLYLQRYRPLDSIVQFWYRSKDPSWIGQHLVPRTFIEPEASLEEQRKMIREADPSALDYYPQMLLALCKHLRRRNEHGDVDVDRVFTHGELVTPSVRRYIEDALEAPVHDQYAATEFGTVAWECPEGGYHLSEDLVRAEVCGPEGGEVPPGQPGRLVLTGLVNTALPLIRYSTGDIVETAPGGCSCDTRFRRLGRIRGREEHVFRGSDGKPVYPDSVVDKVAPVEDVLFFQVVARDGGYSLRYVPNAGFDRGPVEECAEELRSELSMEPLELEEVDSVPRTEGGKLRIIRNEQSGTEDVAV